MQVKEFYKLPDDEKAYWKDEIKKSDWDVIGYLHALIEENKTAETFGGETEILMLTDNDSLLSLCTFAPQDEIDNPEMTPWLGFVYTFPEFRGRRCFGEIVKFAEEKARLLGYKALFVSSEEKGLYEKYGFSFLKNAKSVHGYDTQIFKKNI